MHLLPPALPLPHSPAASIFAVRVRDPFKGPSGYDHHTREFVHELHRQGVAVELIDFPHWGPARLAPHQRDRWFELLDRPVDARDAFHFCMPHQVAPDRGLANVNYTMFEGTRISPRWVARGRQHDLVVVPTESSRQAWLDSGVPADRVRVCPLGINTTLFGRPVEPMVLRREDETPLSRYATRFLSVSELRPRKNLVGLLRAWMRATSARDDAVLIVKLGSYVPGWVKLFGYQPRSLQQKVGKGLHEAGPFPGCDLLRCRDAESVRGRHPLHQPVVRRGLGPADGRGGRIRAPVDRRSRDEAEAALLLADDSRT